jgi:hypothetical protein
MLTWQSGGPGSACPGSMHTRRSSCAAAVRSWRLARFPHAQPSLSRLLRAAACPSPRPSFMQQPAHPPSSLPTTNRQLPTATRRSGRARKCTMRRSQPFRSGSSCSWVSDNPPCHALTHSAAGPVALPHAARYACACSTHHSRRAPPPILSRRACRVLGALSRAWPTMAQSNHQHTAFFGLLGSHSETQPIAPTPPLKTPQVGTSPQSPP